MNATTLFENAQEFAEHLHDLRKDRLRREEEIRLRKLTRRSLTSSERQTILLKTARRCHICGDEIGVNESWHADHVFAHAQGGAHSVDNYLPAHSICNNYRWFYGAEEFQWILNLGVWWRTQIERNNSLALKLAEGFVQYEVRRASRRKNMTENIGVE